ncbi:MAG TPA: aldehyde dehydrogenase [Patescibacteria group bacterium]|nr:aldehyde dehydrogenase [Patescibacteria group bacterium]
MGDVLNFIGGEMKAASGGWIDNTDPSTGQVYGRIADSDDKDLQLAVDAAQSAFPKWRDTSGAQRAACLNKLADLIDARREEFVRAESVDNGKPVSLARAIDIPRGAANLRAFAKMAAEFGGQTYDKPGVHSYTLRQPHGVVSTISPWNLPLLLFTWKLGPALAAGNCVISKPSELTPMTAHMLSSLANDAGFPKGVLNVLHGRGAKIGAAITSHAAIPAISFTGGTKTGTEIYSNAAKKLKKISLELGGKNPTIIFADADFDRAIEGATLAAFANQGQICLCGSRLFVQESLYEKFKAAFLKRVSAIRIGDPLEDTTQHGAMVSKDHMDKVLGYIDLAEKEGGKVLTGGQRHLMNGRCKDGYFIEPTVIEGLPHTCRTNQEEIFGPVVTLMPFRDEDDVIAMANSTEYGLASSVWTTDKEKARRMAAQLESGIVWVNCWNLRDLDTPFGGYKKSGVGREGTWDAMHFFTQQKSVTTPA